MILKCYKHFRVQSRGQILCKHTFIYTSFTDYKYKSCLTSPRICRYKYWISSLNNFINLILAIQIPQSLGRYSPDQDLVLSMTHTQMKCLRSGHLRKIFSGGKNQSHFFMWVDCKRADLKLYGKTNGCVQKNIRFFTEATRMRKAQSRISDATCHFTSISVSCPHLNGHYCLYPLPMYVTCML